MGITRTSQTSGCQLAGWNLCRFVALTCTLVASTASAQSRLLQTLHQPAAIVPSVQLVDLSEDLQWQFKRQEGALQVPLRDVVRWGGWQGVTRKPAVWLSDGSWLCGNHLLVNQDGVEIQPEWFAPVRIPLNLVRGVVLVPASSRQDWEARLQQMQGAAGQSDQVWLAGDDRVAGVVRFPGSSANNESGIITVEGAGRGMRMELDEVEAVAFAPALFEPLGAVQPGLTLSLSDGSNLMLHQMRAQRGTLQLELSCGLLLNSLDSRTEFTQSLTGICSSTATTSFLSQQKEASYRQVSDRLQWELGRDQDLWGRQLVVQGFLVPRGLATHAVSQVAYRCDGLPARFLAEVVLAEPPAGGELAFSSVRCQVLVAKGGRLQTAASIALDQQHPVSLLDVDLQSVQLLALVTEAGSFGSFGDHVLWLDARITKMPVK